MKLLIIEDEPSLLKSIIDYFSKEEFLCETASTFEQGLQKIDLYDYDCIVLDITLPGGSGLKLLQYLREDKKQDGVVIISAKNSLDDKIKGLDLGADDYLTKPFHLSELSARIKAVIRRKCANGGNGICYFYNAESFQKTGTIQFSSDADDVLYDLKSGKIYVAYGEGGIAIVDANNHRLIGDIKLPAHPERFQLDKNEEKIFVNLPDAGIIGVIDLKRIRLSEEWRNVKASANFPMALDTLHHRLFIGYRHPAELAVLDSRTGR